MEAASHLLPLVKPLLECLIGTLKLDPNVLRDSTLQRLELVHMEACLHVSATTWSTCFRELRALANGKLAKLNPVELNELYDELWVVGKLLISPDCLGLDTLEDAHTPWVRPVRVANDPWCTTFDEQTSGTKAPPLPPPPPPPLCALCLYDPIFNPFPPPSLPRLASEIFEIDRTPPNTLPFLRKFSGFLGRGYRSRCFAHWANT